MSHGEGLSGESAVLDNGEEKLLLGHRGQQEANAVAEEIKRAFPSYSKEIRVVQDRINL